MIQGYDSWKTTPPDDPDPEVYCVQCGLPLYEGDGVHAMIGWMCEDCIRDEGIDCEESFIRLHRKRLKRERQAYEEAEREDRENEYIV